MAAIIAFFVGGLFGWFVAALSAVAAFSPDDSEYNERNGNNR